MEPTGGSSNPTLQGDTLSPGVSQAAVLSGCCYQGEAGVFGPPPESQPEQQCVLTSKMYAESLPGQASPPPMGPMGTDQGSRLARAKRGGS